MCGIVGYSGKEKISQEELKILLYFAEERGDESCGVATPSNIMKKGEDPHDFIRRKLPTDRVVIGHTRKATTGEVSDENSHPFTNGNIVGVHNGVIYNFDDLQKEEKTNYNVDSEIIWHLMSKYGLKETLPKLSGWMALAWLDIDDRLNLYRHTAPLHIGYKDGNLYFGSKETYLKAIDCDDIEEIDRHFHYVIDEGEIVQENDLTDMKYVPKRRHGVVKNGGGQNTQSKDESPPFTKRGDFDKPDGVPAFASFTIAEQPAGVGYYYWFSSRDINQLHVQPVTLLIPNWHPQQHKFSLKDTHDVKRLHRIYPDVLYAQDVYDKIQKNVGNLNL